MTDATSAPPKPASPTREIWQQFRTHKGALFGLIVLSLLILFVVIGPMLWDPPQRLSDTIRMKNQGPSLKAPFGTDQLGRDLLLRMMLAGRVSLAVGLVAMVIAIVFGTLIGTRLPVTFTYSYSVATLVSAGFAAVPSAVADEELAAGV